MQEADIRPTRVEVDLSVLGANLEAIRRHVGAARVMPILKANAYGHGIVEVGRHLDGLGVDALGVAYLEEGEALREAGVTAPILVMSGVVGRQVPRFLAADLAITVPSVAKLEHVQQVANDLGTTARVHLKFDTGMGRLGQSHRTAGQLLDATLGAPNVLVEGVYSHFATSDEADRSMTEAQIERFMGILEWFDDRGLPTPTRHLANSGGVLGYPESHLDMVRPGLLLYGAYPSPDVPRTVEVAPALRWLSQVVYFKVVPAGDTVSYGATWEAPSDTRVVTLPVGYGDGYARAHSNRAHVLVRGERKPVVGRVCMDHVMVDLGPDGTAYNGDDVVLIGRDGDEAISIEDVAESAGTVPWEVLTSISPRVPRVYV
ncbi:MAG: alanine racemase [Acidimicrobiia bacterium]|nr:alanine racemase [Acidimicrobiia bacterium]